jgi:membrane dipeptidase
MTHPTDPAVFDGHNDLLFQLYVEGKGIAPVLDGWDGHIDAAKARAGGFGGGLFAVFVPPGGAFEIVSQSMRDAAYDVPFPPALAWPDALHTALAELRLLYELEGAGVLTICRTVAEIRAVFGTGRMAAVIHLEGAEPIDPELVTLETLYRAGLRAVGPVWSRPNASGAMAFRSGFPRRPIRGRG